MKVFKVKQVRIMVFGILIPTALILIAIINGVYKELMQDFPIFLCGGAKQLLNKDTEPLMMFSVIVAVLITLILCMFLLKLFFAEFIYWRSKYVIEDLSSETEESFTKKDIISRFFVVTFEEFIFRWLVLGVLTKIPFLSGTFAFYILFLTGNGIWSLLHLFDFDFSKKRNKIVKLIPGYQGRYRFLFPFVGGLFLTFIYIKYGFYIVTITHLVYNIVVDIIEGSENSH